MLGDLGLGKALDMSSRLTMIAGTPTFVAPEQAQGERLDARADQYSLAALTYLLFTGRAPYAHASLAAAAAPGEPPALSAPGREFPEAVEQVVGRALVPDREQRWPDVTTYVAALRAALGDEVVEAMPEPWLPLDPRAHPAGRPADTAPRRGALAEPTPPPRRHRRLAAACAAIGGAGDGGRGRLAATAAPTTPRPCPTKAARSASRCRRSGGGAVARAGWRPPTTRAVRRALGRDAEGWTSRTPTTRASSWGSCPARSSRPRCRSTRSAAGAVSGHRRRRPAPVRDRRVHDCPGGLLTVERVIKVADNRLLWVQVRSEDGATANSVLDSVTTHGI